MHSGESDIVLRVGDGTTMAAYVARPAGSGPFPGLIVFPEAFGVNHHIRDVCDRFAKEGYLAIAPELFHRTAPVGFDCPYPEFMAKALPHMNAVTPTGLEHDARAAWDWLQAQPQVRQGAIACVGYCLGGRTAFLANSVKPFAAAVSFYGGGIVPGLLPRAAMQHGPILLFWGGLDTHIPPEHPPQVAQALRMAKKPHINVEVSFADHGFFCNERGSYNAQAAAEAWALTLAFLRENLRGK
jgi:carboxymethylenebutenolidase